MNEIEDPVPPRIHASNKVGPRHRTLRWNAGGEWAEISLGLKLREVRHLAFAHELVQELGVHAVDAQNDQTLIAERMRWGGAAGRQRRHGYEKQGSPQCFLQRVNPRRSSFRL